MTPRRLWSGRRAWHPLLLALLCSTLAACHRQPPIPTPVPRTPVPFSPWAITSENAQEVDLLRCMQNVGRPLAFSPDGRLLAVTCESGICLHDAHSLQLVRGLGTPDAYYSAAFSPDGTLLAAGTGSGKVLLWRVSDGAVERTLQAPDRRLWAVAFSPDGATLVASSLSPDVFAWRIADGALLHSFAGRVPRGINPPQAVAACLSPDAALLVLKESHVAQIWRTGDGTLLRTLRGPGWRTGTLAFSSDGTLLAAASNSGIVLWERQQGMSVAVRTIGGTNGDALAFSPDGALLATSGGYRRLLLQRVKDGTTLLAIETKQQKSIGDVLFSPDGSLLVTWGGGVTCLWGLAP